ncbi:MAG: DUF3597 domain-containing protein [Gemmatimonadales bacterium]
MSIFGKLRDKIFGKDEFSDVSSGSTSVNTGHSSPPAGSAITERDVEALLAKRAAAASEPLNWRTSIVDLMKLVDMDSSLSERKELATELGYTGDMNDSAAMNIWLHKQVMRKLAEHGGTVPADLLD